MAKVTLTDIANISGNPASAEVNINANFAALQDQIDLLLSRDGESPNTMSSNLDMNNKRILNLPAPTNSSEPARLQDVTDAIEGATSATLISVEDAAGYYTAGTVEGVLAELQTGGATPKYTLSIDETAEAASPVSLQYNSDILDIRRYMTAEQASGNGLVDCRDAIQAAADSLQDNKGGILFVPRGTFLVIGTITLKPKTIVMGEGWASTINFNAQNNFDNLFENRLATSGADGTLEFYNLNLNISNPSAFVGSTAIDLRDRSGGGTEHSSYCKIVNVKFSNWTRAGIYMDESTVSYIDLCTFQSIKNILHATSAGQSWPILINGAGNGVEISRIHVIDSDGVLRVSGVDTSATLVLRNSTFEDSANYANAELSEHIFVEGAVAFSFIENYIEGLRTGPSGGPGTDAVIRLKNVRQATIARNYLQSDLSGTDVSYRFVRVEADCQNVIIEGNDMEDPTNAYALVETGAEDTIIRNNRYAFGGVVETDVDSIRTHISGSCILENNDYTQTIAYAASVTPNARNGKSVEIGALTNNITINAPTLPPDEAGAPRDLIFQLLQDGTGGRTVTWNSVYKSNYSNTGNTANTRNIVRFYWDGSEWVGNASGWF